MPHPTTPRPMQQALQPLIAGAVLASIHPALAADSIEIDHLGVATGDDPLGLRVILYHPDDGAFAQWANAIEATEFGTPRPTSRPGELSYTALGRVGTTPFEVNCVSRRGEWVWRTSGAGVHKRDSTKDGAVAACGDLIVGVADVTDWQVPDRRCPGCTTADASLADMR
ncbi:hypothetical protein [Streptomyces sp. H51]|uniref:hypothetical protein n=1 Tax=Streptomyces sp. H51 TaxID=3111770 RepID=UPI002D77BC49|nr:hypothetical protein [Streptomyces sp. H51]